MAVSLPSKIFKILTAALKGNHATAREIKFQPFINIFTTYFGCTINKRKGNLVKVLPPTEGQGIWYWKRVPFFLRKPVSGTLERADVYKLRKTFNTLYGWDRDTFVRGCD